MTKWMIQLGAFNIRYELRTKIKSQPLANFGNPQPQFTTRGRKKCNMIDIILEDGWQLLIDGASDMRGT